MKKETFNEVHIGLVSHYTKEWTEYVTLTAGQ